jgi:ATP phosphoribosyltransferase
MAGPETTLRLGLPKGRMEQGILRLLEAAGIQVRVSTRGYRPWLSLPGADAKVLKPQNIIEMVHAGSRHVGFAGADWVAELGYEDDPDLIELLDTGLDRVQVVVAAPDRVVRDGRLQPPPGRPLVLASELPRLAQRWIDASGISARVLRTYGATEVFPPDDADAIVDIAATGDTLKANKLQVVDTVITSSTRLYAHRPSLEDAAVRARVDELVLLLQAALDARHRAMVDLNVAASDLDAVLEILPSLRQPTISALRGEDGYAIRSAVPRDQLTTLIPQLKRAGAGDIVVTQPTQLVR